MLSGITRIGHIGLAVRDLDRMVRFYTEVLGFELSEDFEYPEEEVGHGTTVTAGAFLRCNSIHHCISLFAIKQELDAPGRQPPYGLHHVAFELASPERLLELCNHLKEAGVEIVSERRGGPGNQPRFYVRDPEGNMLEFYWGIDQIGWDGVARRYDPIEEIKLSEFDFDAYKQRAEKDAAEAKATKRPEPAGS